MATAADLAAARSEPEWEDQRCPNCKWSGFTDDGVVDYCHFNPPTTEGLPVIGDDDWCSKWEWDE